MESIKTRNIILILLALGVVGSVAGRKIKDIRRYNTSKKAYGDKNVAIAQRLYIAMFPDGKPNAKFSIFNPFSSFNVVADQFKSSADTDKLLEIARDRIVAEDFNKITKAYKRLYDSNLILDLQKALGGEAFLQFDDIIKNKKKTDANPKKHNQILDNLAEKIYNDVTSFGMADDDLYADLLYLNDADFEYVYMQFNTIAESNGTDDSLAKEIEDDDWTIDNADELKERFLKLGLK